MDRLQARNHDTQHPTIINICEYDFFRFQKFDIKITKFQLLFLGILDVKKFVKLFTDVDEEITKRKKWIRDTKDYSKYTRDLINKYVFVIFSSLHSKQALRIPILLINMN